MKTYFKIGNNNYSNYVQGLKVTKQHKYTSSTNAAGNTVVDYINAKRKLDVTFIPMFDDEAIHILNDIDDMVVTCSFLNPLTNGLDTITGIIPKNNIEYYTIQSDRVIYQKFKISIEEL